LFYNLVTKKEKELMKETKLGEFEEVLLLDKGFLTSEMGQPSATRGGRRKRIYEITAFGERTLRASRDFKMDLWRQFPGLAFTG